MRKNGINREIREIPGGICAPVGFKVNAVACGLRENGDLDLGLLASERRCSAAAVYSTSAQTSDPVLVTKKHLAKGYACALLVNGGIANVSTESEGKRTENLCRALERDGHYSASETVVASTGEIGKRLDFDLMESRLKELAQGLESSERKGDAFARAMSSSEGTACQFSFAFDLGDIPCKIGGVYKGNLHVNPNMATTLVFLTTDVRITSEMLQKALSSEVRETLNMLDLDGSPSPNDMACILANGQADNYLISRADTEYEKFRYVLRKVLLRICRKIVINEGERRPFECRVTGTKSKQIARALARSLVGSPALKKSLEKRRVDLHCVLFAAAEYASELSLSKLRVSLFSGERTLLLYGDGIAIEHSEETLKTRLSQEMLRIELDLGDGNYAATAFGALPY